MAYLVQISKKIDSIGTTQELKTQLRIFIENRDDLLILQYILNVFLVPNIQN